MPAPEYLPLSPDQRLPKLENQSLRVILIADAACTTERRREVAEWLVRNRCLYFIAWGVDCVKWHDEVDFANLRQWDPEEVPDEAHVMTTWHENEPLSEALWFAQFCAHHPTQELERDLIVHVTSLPARNRILGEWDRARDG